jgi:hypothetical protein
MASRYELLIKLDFDPYENFAKPNPVDYEGEASILFQLLSPADKIIIHADQTIEFERNLALINLDTNQYVVITHDFLNESDDLYEIIAASTMPAGNYRLSMKFLSETKLDGFFRSNYQEFGTTR